MSGENTSSTSAWYAIYTKPLQEDRAGSNLRAWNLETFTPKIQERRYNQFTGKPTPVAKPFFPRYIFARFEAETMLHKVSFVRGVQSVVGFGAGPAPIDDELIEIIKSRTGEDGFVNFGEQLKRGDRVLINDGPVKDFVGIFEREVSASARVVVLLTCAKYQCRLSVGREQVTKTHS
ncbi:MAG: transcriptional antiterminator RfaH [Pyrinomonadaceae bacterium]|nr:transcriptional antiterminator RfaH [Pyrinomonadaceae bacterium]